MGLDIWSSDGARDRSINQTMNNVPLNALRAFAAIYEAGGVRAAARVLDVSHSAVSRHLRELQLWLGVDLFEGDERRIDRLTPQGRNLARTLLSSFQAIESAAGSVRESRPRNSVVVATTPSVAGRWLLPRLSDFQEKFAWIELSVNVEQRLVDPPAGATQIGLRIGEGTWPDVVSEPLMDDRLFPVMSPAFWAAHGRPGRAEDLARLPLLHDRDPFASWETWRDAFPHINLNVRSGPRFSSSDLVLQAAAQGAGVALARGRLAERDLSTGVLLRPFVDDELRLAQAYWMVTAKQAPQSAAMEAVVGWLRDQASQIDPASSQTTST